MYIYGSTEIDKQGRISLAGFFPEGEIPKKAGLAIDSELNMIVVEKCGTFNKDAARTVVKLDDNKRIIVPKWIRNELEENQQLLFIYHDGIRYLSPKTKSIL